MTGAFSRLFNGEIHRTSLKDINPLEHEPSEPSNSEHFNDGPKDGEILNQNTYFQKRFKGWVNAMVKKAEAMAVDLALSSSSPRDYGVHVESPMFDTYGDAKNSLYENQATIGSSVYFSIENVTIMPNSNGVYQWSANLKLYDRFGFDQDNWQHFTPLGRVAEPRTAIRAFWRLQGSFTID